MSSKYGGRVRAEDSDRERFPALQEELGEDPARFLDVDLEAKGELVMARIRGIDYFETLNAWLAVERRLHGGRTAVVDAIEERRAHLEANGERTELAPEELDRLHQSSLPDDDQDDVETWRHEKCGSTDVDQESSRTWFCNECGLRTNRVQRLDEEAAPA